jgi:hypothetical protein
MLLGVLAKAAQAVMGILRDPIGFLGNLVSAVGGGLKQFMNNAGRHLQQGVLSWLLGTAATAGITLPTSFDVVGILLMIASLLGLTWANLRARLARKLPKEAMAAIEAGEHALPLVLEVRKRGIRALWDDLRDRVGDLKKTLIDNLVSYLLPTIIMAGITWIISLFNPASAFIRACKMIIDIIKFIVTNGRQIIEFVNTVLDAVIAIAKGGAGGVAGLVEKALARSIPVLIGALAALLGVGGIAGKVKEIFQKLARPVNKAIDWVIGKIVGLAKKVWAKLKALGKKLKDKFKKDPKKDKKPSDERSAADKLAAVRAAAAEVESIAGPAPDQKQLSRQLPAIRAKHKLTNLYVKTFPDGEFEVIAEINPRHATKKWPPGETKYTIVVNGKKQLKPEYTGGQMIRRRLYSSSNRGPTQRIIKKFVTPRAYVKDEATGGFKKSAYETATHWEGAPGQIVSIGDDRTKPTLEHDLPVVTHWNTKGNNTDQSTRITFYHFKGREDEAKVVMFKVNRETAESAEYTAKLGPDFKEPGQS